ncbi:metallophosphoesterase [Paenibacillus sp. FSL K6-1122]|uniref:metallophosphoesterase n=1 Tax=Paenibacillus sp. FSL K6-1122 TaxID=2954512 RepID=UPI0030EC4588
MTPTVIKRGSNESITDYHIRLGDNLELYELNWTKAAELLNQESEEEYTESRWRKKYASYVEWKPIILEKYATSEVVDEVQDATIELKKERIKLQTEKIEYNKMIREQGRADLLEEKIIEAVNNRPTIHIPDIHIKKNNAKRDFLFPIADMHDGVSFKLFGWEGELLNEYSPEILEKRMWKLLEEFVSINDEQKINHVTLPNLGDSIDGILRMSQLMSLKMGVTDSAIHFAEFMSQWLNELSKYCLVDYFSIFGNHDQLRLLSGKRDEFPHENAQKWITKLISANLKDNKNVSVTNCNEFMYLDILGTKILGVHGENEKNLENSIKDYSLTYNKPIHLLLSGHLHHSHEKTIGMSGMRDIEYVQSPSIIGIDDYSLKLKKTSNAGAKVMILEENKGRTLTYNIRL